MAKRVALGILIASALIATPAFSQRDIDQWAIIYADLVVLIARCKGVVNVNAKVAEKAALKYAMAIEQKYGPMQRNKFVEEHLEVAELELEIDGARKWCSETANRVRRHEPQVFR